MNEMLKIADFFSFICQQLSTLEKYAPWADDQRVVGKLKQLKIGVEFLQLFFWSFDELDEQSRIRITAFRVLWEVKPNGLVQKSMKDTWPLDVQAFLSLAFDFEGKIKQSKLLLQQLCEYMLRSLTQLYEGYSPRYQIDILKDMNQIDILKDKNQIDILKDKVAFMEKLSGNLDDHASCKKLDRIKKYAGDFMKNAGCLTILFWAKEGDEESATEMNILLYDGSHKFILYAPDFSFLISENLLNSDTILAIAGFVDFFFNHLDDDFLILGDPLTLVFISLCNTPHESVEAE